MELVMRISVVGPITFVNEDKSLEQAFGRALAITRRLSKVRRCHYRLSEAGAPKPLLDLLMRTRLRLEAENRWGKS